MNDLLYPVAAAVAWLALAYRLARGLRRDPRDPALYVVCTAFALMGLIFTVSTPAVWQRIDAVLGVPNFSLLFSQSAVIAFSGTIQCLIIFWTHPPRAGWRRARWRIFWVLCVLAGMAVLFSLASPREERPRDAAATYAHDPMYAVYLGCYITMVAVGVLDIIRLCVPYARAAGRTWLSRGMWTTAVGAGFGLGYCAVRAATVIGAQTGVDPLRYEFLVPLLSSGGALLIVVGLTLPSLGPWLSRLGGVRARRRSYQSLRPLWEAAAVTVPEVVLDAPGAARFALADLDHRLSRRVIEIGDAVRQVRGHLDPRVEAVAVAAARAAGMPPSRCRAIGYAASLRVALTRFEYERRAACPAIVRWGTPDSPSYPADQGAQPHDRREGGDAERARRARWDAWQHRLPRPDAAALAAVGAAERAAAAERSAAGEAGPAAADRAADSGRTTGSARPAAGRDFAAEVTWLVEVAHALRTSPIAAAAAAQPSSREPV